MADSPNKRRPWAARVLLVLGLAVGFALPCGYLAVAADRSTGEALAVLDDERAGIQYVAPLADLITELAAGQSAAVHAAAVPADAIRGAVQRLQDTDARIGDRLATGQRFADLSRRITTLVASHDTGVQAFTDYSDVLDLALALNSKVADSSQLILDPDLDSYHLVDSAVVQAPALMVNSGRMADLVWLADRHAGHPATAFDGRVFAARDRVATSAAGIDADVRTAFDATSSPTLAPALAGPLDQFRKAVSSFAPVTSLADLSVPTSQTQAIQQAREQVAASAGRVQTTTLAQLDAILIGRQHSLQQQRDVDYAMVVLAVVALAVAAMRRPAATNHQDADGDQPAQEPELIDQSVQDHGDTRTLVPEEELTRAGRAVVRRPRGAGRGAQ